MKKLMFLFLIFTTLALSQNFTIRSLTGRTSSNLTGTDIFLISNSAGALTKVSYTNIMANLDDEAFVWTGNHDFNATTSITGGTFYIQNVKTASTAGELANTSSYTYLKYKGTQEDTLATWRHIWQDNITIYGTWSFNASVDFTTSGTFRLPTNNNGALGGTLFYADLSRDLILYEANDVGLIDTVVSRYQAFSADNTIYGAWTFNGDVVMAGLISYPTGADIVPTATWDVSGLPQVVVVLVNVDVTVTSMTGAVDGQILHIIGGDTQGDYVTIQDNSTINLRSDEDFILNEQWCSITLIYTDQNTNEWTEISRSHSTTEDFKNVDVNGALDVVGRATFGLDRIDTPSSSINLGEGSATQAVTNTFSIMAGSGGVYSVVTDFTGLTTTGTRLTIQCHPSAPDGFDIADNANIVCNGGANIVMTAGDIAEFILNGDGKWYSTSPVANNN